MFNLAERKISEPNQCTPPKIGPSTYFLEKDTSVKQCACPFLTRSQRSTLNRGFQVDALYNGEVPNRRIKGCSSLANKAPRFIVEKINEGPGPYTYNPRKPGKRALRQIVGQGRLYNCRVPYSVEAVGLSIPTRIDENGYWINEKNKLVKIPPNVYDDTLGPAYYAEPRWKCSATEAYKCCRWSLSKGPRSGTLINDAPGPGTYDPAIGNKCLMDNPKDVDYRALARQFAFVPRTLLAQEMRLNNENFPAPGEYDVNTSSFNTKPSISIKPRPFLNRAPRFRAPCVKDEEPDVTKPKAVCDDIPGPSSYDVRFTSRDKKTFSIQNVPFSVLGARTPISHDLELPGPAHYLVLGSITEKLTKKKLRENHMVPFGKTSPRKISFVEKDSYFMPSPADYIVEALWKDKKIGDSSNFKSTTKRTADITKANYCDANAATYNITEPFRWNATRQSHYCGSAAFQQTRRRGPLFQPILGPGPAVYSNQGSIGGRGYQINTSPRFQDFPESPGPATYKIHPTIQSSIHKANSTYNLRLREFVRHKKLRLPPSETFARWSRISKKRKNLKWFHDHDMAQPKIRDYIKEDFEDDYGPVNKS